MGQRQKVTLVLVSIFLIQLYCTWGSEICYTPRYKVSCYDECKQRGEGYYWCQTREGWDYCPLLKNNYEGYECRAKYPCVKRDKSYRWCRTMAGSLGFCAKVEPKTMLHLSLTYQSLCIDECLYDSNKNYYWCNTEEGWDYCSPAADVTYRNELCRSDHHCDTHGETYTWCNTDSNWDYCGLIKPNECGYTTSSRKRRELDDLTVICTRIDKGNKKEMTFFAEPDSTAITDIGGYRNEITDLISQWNNGYLRNQARSELITSRHLRIDLQGRINRNDQCYYNLQIQINTRRTSRTSTTVAQVLVPLNEDVPARYIRMAFTESFRRRARLFVEVNHGNPSIRRGQNRKKQPDPIPLICIQ